MNFYDSCTGKVYKKSLYARKRQMYYEIVKNKEEAAAVMNWNSMYAIRKISVNIAGRYPKNQEGTSRIHWYSSGFKHLRNHFALLLRVSKKLTEISVGDNVYTDINKTQGGQSWLKFYL